MPQINAKMWLICVFFNENGNKITTFQPTNGGHVVVGVLKGICKRLKETSNVDD
jgi:hypothetical protein